MPTLPWKNARKNYKINSWMEEKRMLELPETLTVALLLRASVWKALVAIKTEHLLNVL